MKGKKLLGQSNKLDTHEKNIELISNCINIDTNIKLPYLSKVKIV